MAPVVVLDLEVTLFERDAVVLGGGVDDGKGSRAVGAFEVFVLDDGDLGAGGWFEEAGVFERGDLVGGGLRFGLGLGGWWRWLVQKG